MRHCTVLVLTLLTGATVPAASLPLIPWPHHLEVATGRLILSTRSRVAATNPSLLPLAEVLARELYQITGLRLAPVTAAGRAGDIVLVPDPKLTGENHTLVVSDRATVRAGTAEALARATAPLLQAVMVDGGTVGLPHLTLHDAPHSPFRALMVDIARQPHSLDTLKQCVVLCRLYQLRYLQLHLSDDQAVAFACAAFPRIATPGRHLTRAELRDLDAFARVRGVTLIPEFDAPGHTTALRRARPELFGAPGLSVVNLGKEAVYEALERIIDDLCELFPHAPYLHIGADEAYFANLARDPLAQARIRARGYDNVHDLFYEYIVRMNRRIRGHGKQTLMWESFPGTGSRHIEIPRDITVIAWETAYQLPQSLLAHGYRIINASWKPNYVTPGWRWDPAYIYAGNPYRWENHWRVAPSYVPIQLPPEPNDRIRGGMMCSWECRDEMEIPGLRRRLPALAERFGSPDANRPWADFAARLAVIDRRLQHLIRPVAIQAEGLTLPDYEGPFYNRENHFGRQVTVSLSPLVPGAAIHYTLDGTVPTAASPRATDPLTLTRTTTLRTRLYDADGSPLGFIATVPYEHHPLTADVDGLLMRVPHDNGRGRPRTQFGDSVTITLHNARPDTTIRFRTDGRAPASQDPVVTGPLVIDQSATVTARCFDAQGRPVGEPWQRRFEHTDAEDNLTTGKPASASHRIPAAGPEWAVDGIVNRDFHWDSGAPAPQWWQVDLQTVHTLTGVQIITYWDGHRYYQYTVATSVDGERWQEVVDYRRNTEPATAQGFTHRFEPVAARYLRVTMLRNSANPGLHLVEVRALEAGPATTDGPR